MLNPTVKHYCLDFVLKNSKQIKLYNCPKFEK